MATFSLSFLCTQSLQIYSPRPSKTPAAWLFPIGVGVMVYNYILLIILFEIDLSFFKDLPIFLLLIYWSFKLGITDVYFDVFSYLNKSIVQIPHSFILTLLNLVINVCLPDCLRLIQIRVRYWYLEDLSESILFIKWFLQLRPLDPWSGIIWEDLDVFLIDLTYPVYIR